jgi:hypothetical protein
MKYNQNLEIVHFGKQLINGKPGLKWILTERGCESDTQPSASITCGFLMANMWLP